jgi:hypothetical protein
MPSLKIVEPDVNDAAEHSILVQHAFTAIDAATTAEDVKKVLDQWAGLAAYARKAKEKQLEADAAEIKMRAERRLGEMMQAQKETFGLNQGGRPKTGVSETPVSEKPPTLPEAGIDKNLAKNARKEAAKSKEQFEEDVVEKKSGILAPKMKPIAEAGGAGHIKDDAEASAEKPAPATAKPNAAPTVKDTALREFDDLIGRLLQKTRKAEPKRFAETGFPGDELMRLGEFLVKVASARLAARR